MRSDHLRSQRTCIISFHLVTGPCRVPRRTVPGLKMKKLKLGFKQDPWLVMSSKIKISTQAFDSTDGSNPVLDVEPKADPVVDWA